MGKALYRKYRSKSLAEVVGQSHVTGILARSLKQGKVAHAYLLTGPRGVGKTSIARILAHEINQLPYADESTHLDIIEIDAASNNGVDDVRDLRDKARLAPVSATKKVYIIDEVHMLSKAAFNALLKTLEEPPEHVVFILATTDVDKLPATIISRTQRFAFRAIAHADIVSHLRHIADAEKISIDDEALATIATRGDGSFRDSISLLDQLSSLSDKSQTITSELVESTLGLASAQTVQSIVDAVSSRDTSKLVSLLDEIEQSGVQPTVLASQLTHAIRRKIAEQPQLVPLLDGLLDVTKSSQPSLKLLTTLVAHIVPKPKSAPLAAAPIATISQPAPVPATPVAAAPKPVTVQPTAPPVRKSTPAPTQATAQVAQPAPAPDAPPREAVAANPDGFDWEKLLEHVRGKYVALNAVLSKCTPELDGETLILYTKNKFNKTKLDDAKYRPMLAECIIAIGAGDLLVETIPTAPPPKDSVAAAVADIMGGGEEVSV